MRRLTAVLASAFLLACGSEPAGLDGGPQVAQSVQVVEGDGQTVSVTESTDTVSALVEGEAGPVEGDLTTWEVDGPSECGDWEATALESNASGEVHNVLHVGTVADTRADVDCIFRVVHSEQGAPAPLVGSVEVEVLPGAAVDTVPPGSTLGGEPPVEADPTWLLDQHDNPVPYRLVADSVVEPQSDSLGTPEARSLVMREAAANGDSAVVCARRDGDLVLPMLARIVRGSTQIVLETHGDSDPENDFGFVQREDCI